MLKPIRNIGSRRYFSSDGGGGGVKPLFRIQARVLEFSVLMFPAIIAFAYVTQYAPTEEALEEEIKKRYADDLEKVYEKNKHMGEFFRKTLDTKNVEADQQFYELLKAGRNEKKRMHSVDEKLYGTKEGMEERKRQELIRQRRKLNMPTDDLETEEEKAIAKKRKGKKVKGETVGAVVDNTTTTTTVPSEPVTNVVAQPPSAVDAKSVAAVTIVAVLAATVGFLAGGNKRN